MPSLRQSVATSTCCSCEHSEAIRSSRSAGGERASDGGDLDVLAESVAQMLGDVFGGRDEAAEDDRLMAVLRRAP